MQDFDTYQSPFSWRYGSAEMRKVWSETNKRILWRKLWVALAQAELNQGLVTRDQLDDLISHSEHIDIPLALSHEAVSKHDLMAELKVYADQCKVGGSIIHLGATSMDIKDNAEALQVRKSIDLILEKNQQLLSALADFISRTASLPCMAYTHLQPAEPTTLGYRFANLAQDLLADFRALMDQQKVFKGKGFKGAVGNAASYIELFGVEGFTQLEADISASLDLPFCTLTTQTYPRKQEYDLLCVLAGIAGTLYKFAFDLRLLQSQGIAELSEPFGRDQVGSSAMPFKRNPIHSEKIDSLARMISAAPQTAWQNAANSLLERTLDDSANRRTLLPETFLALDEIISTSIYLIENMHINRKAIEDNLSKYGPFSAVERIMLAAVKHGADRQEMHARLREHSLAAWKSIEDGSPNPLQDLITNDPVLTKFLSKEELSALMNVDNYLGFSEKRSLGLVEEIIRLIGS